MNDLHDGVWPIKLPPDREAFHRDRPNWEKERIDSILANIRPGILLIDVGTEVGDYAALFSYLGARVVCVEPEPRYWPTIRRHFELNGLLPAFCFAGFASDVTDLFPPRPNFRSGGDIKNVWPYCAEGYAEDWHGFRNMLETADATPQVRLDDLCAPEMGKVGILNIDVEGAELRVLQGASRVISEDRPLVYVSIHVPMMLNDYGIVPEDIFVYMSSFGYSATFLHEDHENHYLFSPL